MLDSNWDERFAELEHRVMVLELNQASKPGRKPDEITRKVLEFLKKHPGLKFNSGSITSNIGMGDTKVVSSRLKTLFGRGLIKAEKVDMLSAMYWYEEEDKS